jgi:hypothetical protein
MISAFLSSIKWIFALVAVFVVGSIAWLYIAEYLDTYWFRYRMTVEIEADGKVHTGSSVIEVAYTYNRFGGLRKWYTRVRGVAPIVEIGRYGTIVAALSMDYADYGRQDLAAGYKSGEREIPLPADSIPFGAFGVNEPKQLNAKLGKVNLTKYNPSFIWIPASGNWQDARQLYPMDFGATISRSVRLRDVTVEPTTGGGAPVRVKIENVPRWLVELREIQKQSFRGKEGHFIINVYSFIERRH